MSKLNDPWIQVTPEIIEEPVRTTAAKWVFSFMKGNHPRFHKTLRWILATGIPIYEGSLEGYNRYLDGSSELNSYISWSTQVNALIWFNDALMEGGYMRRNNIRSTSSTTMFKNRCVSEYANSLYKEFKMKQQVCHGNTT